MPKVVTATITDIQRYSLHDGPGIRTVVFFKGCPLVCQWCQNPETQSAEQEIIFNREYCIGCGTCIGSCRNRCIRVEEGIIYTDTLCCRCGACVQKCPTKARKMAGEEYTLERLVEILMRDIVFYSNSGGGVTLGGGEVTAQNEFAGALLDELRNLGIHTAIETCGYASEKVLTEILQKTNLILFDLKHPDDEIHRLYTGVGNHLILKNLKNAAKSGKSVIVRFPLIPGVNNDGECLRKTAQICLEYGLKEIHVLPFHQVGRSKWYGLQKPYPFDDTPSATSQQAEDAKNVLEQMGLSVNIGGMA